MADICLVVPPSLVLSDERTFMHLGILKVGAVLKHNGVPTDMLDLSGVKNYLDVVETYAKESVTCTFGITATSPQMPASAEIARVIRNHVPDARIILGGPHVTLVNAATKKETARSSLGRAGRAFEKLRSLFDGLVAGDGEIAILRMLENPALGFIDADDRKSDLYLKSSELNLMPFPAREMVDVESYKYTIDGVRALSMIAQLGCPFQCGFCGGRESDYLRRVRLRNTESVVAEMRHIFETYGVRGIMLYDDELNVNKNMVELMDAIARLGDELKVEWRLRGFVKAELFTEAQAQAMHRAGFREVLTGFESGSPLILKNIRKNATRDDNTRCVETARKAGLKVKALMSMGHPGESEETVRETEEWLLSIEPNSFDLTRITVYPGTPYFDHAVPHGSLEDTWTYTVDGHRLHSLEVDFLTDFLFYKGDRGDRAGLNTLATFTDYLSAEELVNLRKETEDRLRAKLGQPYQTDMAGIQYEHSMGMGLPDNILRSA
ncbi:B12-binding domain-containing radical SAM protein [Candidatus Parcubacteria bacterium]|nr:B12-binding domain-containing radical SAM protein [Candidatus Parcubacteria bacterium]